MVVTQGTTSREVMMTMQQCPLAKELTKYTSTGLAVLALQLGGGMRAITNHPISRDSSFVIQPPPENGRNQHRHGDCYLIHVYLRK